MITVGLHNIFLIMHLIFVLTPALGNIAMQYILPQQEAKTLFCRNILKARVVGISRNLLFIHRGEQLIIQPPQTHTQRTAVIIW